MMNIAKFKTLAVDVSSTCYADVQALRERYGET